MELKMKATKLIRWDPLVTKLVEDKLKCTISSNIMIDHTIYTKKQKSLAAIPRNRSKEEFQKYLHSLFNQDGPLIKYQNPDSW